MYKVDVRVDGKEAAATERRRIQEYQRQSRIFNAKQRLIGVRVAIMAKRCFSPYQTAPIDPLYTSTFFYVCSYCSVGCVLRVCVQVDTKALDEQVSEKKTRESIEHQRDEAFGKCTDC